VGGAHKKGGMGVYFLGRICHPASLGCDVPLYHWVQMAKPPGCTRNKHIIEKWRGNSKENPGWSGSFCRKRLETGAIGWAETGEFADRRLKNNGTGLLAQTSGFF